MKADELMIGNWVKPDQCMIPTVYCKVLGIYPDGTVNLDKAERLFTLDELHPIPLTPEILEKNGFEEWDGWYIYSPENTGIEIAWVGTTLRMSGEFGNFEFHAIEYVHQLQNELKLCGISKKIQL